MVINGYFVKEALDNISANADFFTLHDFTRLKPAGYAVVNDKYGYAIVSKMPEPIEGFWGQVYNFFLFVLVISLVMWLLIFFCSGFLNSNRFILKQAMRKKRILPYYQPVISSGGDRLAGFEILTRWFLKDGGAVSPARFIAQAEQNGMLTQLTLYIMACVKKDFHFFRNKGIYLALNVSTVMLQDFSFISALKLFSSAASGEGIKIVIEITERQGIEDMSAFMESLRQIRRAGIMIALDDFGTGFSNLDSLGKILPDYIKATKNLSVTVSKGGMLKSY